MVMQPLQLKITYQVYHSALWFITGDDSELIVLNFTRMLAGLLSMMGGKDMASLFICKSSQGKLSPYHN